MAKDVVELLDGVGVPLLVVVSKEVGEEVDQEVDQEVEDGVALVSAGVVVAVEDSAEVVVDVDVVVFVGHKKPECSSITSLSHPALNIQNCIIKVQKKFTCLHRYSAGFKDSAISPLM